MKKICYAFVLMLCMGLLSACAKKTDVDTGTVIIERRGRIVSVDLEKLDKEYYDADELEAYISQHLDDYIQKNGKTVKLSSFAVEEGVARLEMTYDTYKDYAEFNGIEFYVGSVIAARAAGYDFEAEFQDVRDPEQPKAASKDDVLADDNYKAAIIRAGVDVVVPGRLCYLSGASAKASAKNTVSVTGGDADGETPLAYIIYK